ncbi:cold-shock protein [Mesorhizobium sp. WSM3860]|uniref:cold-shock protein n=1 Tax=Mesorhizobium sp. WSM3860 TaxID=2029403 RepID=UPI0024782E99|nr:cold-shock protein [Mesorhizobium sp. WSM3860]
MSRKCWRSVIRPRKLSYIRVALESPPPERRPVGERGHGQVVQSPKGFGFIAPENREKDIFVHATALTRSRLSTLMEGQKVFVQCGQGKKGPEVRSIRLV